MASLSSLIDKIRSLIEGEPARAIGYGAAVVIFLVANAFGRLPDITFDQAITDAFAAIAMLVTVVETIRHYVSPATTTPTS